jgi:hypothetical protein
VNIVDGRVVSSDVVRGDLRSYCHSIKLNDHQHHLTYFP